MKSTRQLVQRVLHNPKTEQRSFDQNAFAQRYPEFSPLDGKRHVYFVAPLLHPSGYYRMLLPAQELNKTTTHAAIVGQVHKWNFTRAYDDYDLGLNGTLVRWAHDVVLPAMTTDATYMVQLIRQANPKARIVMDIDFHYHALPEFHPAYARVSDQAKELVIDNLRMADLITSPSHPLLDDYHQLLTARYKIEPNLAFLPNLLSECSYQDIPAPRVSENEIVRIGILADATQHQDIVSILPALIHLQEKFGNEVEVILFGWNGKHLGENVLQGIDLSYHKSVGILGFHKVLNAFGLDLALLPIEDHPFNTRKSFIKFLEFAALGIPVIASDVPPYREVIFDGHNGLLASDLSQWKQKLDWMVGDSESRKTMGVLSREFAWRELSYNQDAVELLQSTYS